MRRTAGALMGLIVAAALAGCGGNDTPPGTISEDDLPDSVEVKGITKDWAANQVACQQVNDAEDTAVFAISPNFEEEKMAAASFDLTKGKTHEYVGSSVWRLADPKGAVAKVAQGLDDCVEDNPGTYKRMARVEGYPDALGYDVQDDGRQKFIRRILVPLEDRVVVVSAGREFSDDYSVPPEDLLKKAIAASDEAPKV